MPYQLQDLGNQSTQWNPPAFREQIEKLLNTDAPRYRRLWAYYRNPMRTSGVTSEEQGSERPYRQAQEWGLPSRITGTRSGLEIFSATPVDGVARKEVVIENDIAWRIDTIVDYLFGKPIVLNSAAPDPNRRAVIEQLLRQIIAHNGGIVFLQQLALLGAVYGYIDVLVKFETDGLDSNPAQRTENNNAPTCGTNALGQPPIDSSHGHKESPHTQPIPTPDAAPSGSQADAEASPGHVATAGPKLDHDDASTPGASIHSQEAIESLARRVRLEIVEPARALPLLSPADYRNVCAYAQVYQLPKSEAAKPDQRAGANRAKPSILDRLRSRFSPSIFGTTHNDRTLVVELISPDKWQRYEDEVLVAEGVNSLGRVPLVHIQNSAVPFEYSGASDVEPMIPIQDEINARLSDRAYRITMQSFKMYLGKGIENFTQMPVAPGRMWLTDNENAEVQEFGGDGKTFSEDNHLSDIRQAMDKISGVTPIAAGAIKGRIGRLTSAAALRVTMLALLAKTERKRTSFGPALEQMCDLALQWLDRAGLFSTTPQERRCEIHWPSPIPVNELERLEEAQKKMQLGVPQEVILRELGY